MRYFIIVSNDLKYSKPIFKTIELNFENKHNKRDVSEIATMKILYSHKKLTIVVKIYDVYVCHGIAAWATSISIYKYEKGDWYQQS